MMSVKKLPFLPEPHTDEEMLVQGATASQPKLTHHAASIVSETHRKGRQAFGYSPSTINFVQYIGKNRN